MNGEYVKKREKKALWSLWCWWIYFQLSVSCSCCFYFVGMFLLTENRGKKDTDCYWCTWQIGMYSLGKLICALVYALGKKWRAYEKLTIFHFNFYVHFFCMTFHVLVHTYYACSYFSSLLFVFKSHCRCLFMSFYSEAITCVALDKLSSFFFFSLKNEYDEGIEMHITNLLHRFFCFSFL